MFRRAIAAVVAKPQNVYVVVRRGCLILKFSVCPTLTLMLVAKPWIVASPAPATCQSLIGSPGSWFSHCTGFPHAADATAGIDANSAVIAMTNEAESTESRRIPNRLEPGRAELKSPTSRNAVEARARR